MTQDTRQKLEKAKKPALAGLAVSVLSAILLWAVDADQLPEPLEQIIKGIAITMSAP